MGIFDQIKGAADSHEAQVEQGIDQAGNVIDEKTGGQHASQVDQAQDFLKDQVGQPNNGQAPQEPPA